MDYEGLGNVDYKGLGDLDYRGLGNKIFDNGPDLSRN